MYLLRSCVKNKVTSPGYVVLITLPAFHRQALKEVHPTPDYDIILYMHDTQKANEIKNTA